MSILALAAEDLVADDDRPEFHKLRINRQDAKKTKTTVTGRKRHSTLSPARSV
jgi:hypothetical protein